MATEKILNTRILNKVDTLENWGKSTLKIKNGEICFATAAASAGNGLEEPVVMVKIGTKEEKTFSELPWSFYAKASDVLAACKSEAGLKAFVNGVIADAGIASSDAMDKLTKRVDTLEGDENTAGSVAKAIKDAIDALDLANTYVAIEDGKSLVDDAEITKLAGVSAGANKVEASTNGNIKIDGVDTVVYTHPDKHTIAEVDGLQGALDGKSDDGHTHTKSEITDFAHTHTSSEITDFATEVAKVKVANAGMADEATKATQDGNGKVISDTYAEKATTLAGYGIGDAYTKDEVDGEIEGAINTFVSAYITSDGGAIDKLQEIANWIDSDKDGAADVIADIEANAEGIENLSGRMDAAEDAIEAIDNHSHINKTVLDGITAEKVTAWDGAESAAKAHADGLNTAMNTRVEALEAIDHEHSNKELLDTYTQTEADLADAVSKKHSHSFSDETALNGITSAKVEAWDKAEQNAKDYADSLAKNYATAEQGGKADTAIQSVTSVAGNGIKATTENNVVTIDWDSEVTLVFDCGGSGVTV